MEKVCLAIDVESGDFGTEIIIQGIVDALKKCKIPFESVLCGDGHQIEKLIDNEITGATAFRKFISIEHCAEKVAAHEDRRSRMWKNRNGASIIRCIALQKEGRVDASVSAGDTAVLMGAALFILGRRKDALRPVLAARLPTVKKGPVLVLDVGANLNCRKEHLVSFAGMGLEYVKGMSGIETPTVALLNIGKEPVKGTDAICAADAVLRSNTVAYTGFIEGDRVLSGDVDIVVCDGFAGNVLLKACESFHRLVGSVLDGKPELLSLLQKNMEVLDSENYGAVPFLGIKGIVLKAHGGSSPKAISSAVLAAEHAVRLQQNAGNHLFA
jgi:glycerol-3-phosphate acyltransferase PlsX